MTFRITFRMTFRKTFRMTFRMTLKMTFKLAFKLAFRKAGNKGDFDEDSKGDFKGDSGLILHCTVILSSLLKFFLPRRAASTGSMQEGQVKLLMSQSSMHPMWYVCMQGRYRIASPGSNSIIHITHLRRDKGDPEL